MFLILLLKECSESVLWGTLQSTAPVSENADVRLPVKTSSWLFLLQAGARSSFGSPVELQPGVHAFSGEPCGWCSTAQGALQPVQVGSDGGSSIMDASRKPTIPRWQRWMLA